ncbi:MAG: hypothetical protein IPM35_29045 [Myxococcales bacterium]|nr:hypothetical protein [Myxococcales bacterium]
MIEILAAVAIAVAQLPSDAQAEQRVGAWDRSLELERAGDARSARELLLTAWGPAPESYEVSVRLAWLTLELGRPSEAIPLYRRACTLPGAGPEATRGLASALVRDGFDALEAGDRSRARRRFEEALQLFPGDRDAERGLELAKERPFTAELWLGGLAVTSSEPTVSGGFGFVHARFAPSDALRLRAAYRLSVTSQERSSQGSGPGRAGRSVTRTRHEGWAGVGLEERSWRAEVLGFGVFAAPAAAVPGQAARLSVGRRVGAALDETLLLPRGDTQLALRPMLFAWPTPALGLAAGARVTHAGDATLVAAELGTSLVTDSVELYASGLLGKARKPVFLDIPMLVDVEGELVAGGVLSVLFPVGPELALGVSAEAHALDDAGDAITYGSLAAGLRWSPRY